MSKLAVFFFHSGYHPYLDFSIAQSRLAHPGSRIILIGDHKNLHRTAATTILPAVDYFAQADRFTAIYQHRSTNSYEFELRCFLRWYVFLEVMEKNNLEEALICDSDTMLFDDFSSLGVQNSTVACGLSVVRDQSDFSWNACPHVSYWRLEALRDFCSFNTRLYQTGDARLNEKWRYHQKFNIPGGICDMTALYLFFTELDDARKINFLHLHDHSVVDINIGSAHNYLPDEFLTHAGGKQITFRSGQPYGFHLPTQSEIRFRALHCQGHNKWRMPSLYHDRKPMRKARFQVFLRYGLRNILTSRLNRKKV